MSHFHHHNWLSVSYRPDPLSVHQGPAVDGRHGRLCDSRVVVLQGSGENLLRRLCRDQGAYSQAIQEGGRVAQVAVTDYLIRSFTTLSDGHSQPTPHTLYSLTLERLDQRSGTSDQFRRRLGATEALPPYLLERSDIGWTQHNDQFYFYLRVGLWQPREASGQNGRNPQTNTSNSALSLSELDELQLTKTLLRMMDSFFETTNLAMLLTHVAVAVPNAIAGMKQSAAVSMIAFVAAVYVLAEPPDWASIWPTKYMNSAKPAMRMTVAVPEGTSSLTMFQTTVPSSLRWR